jgi:hypothetical protein
MQQKPRVLLISQDGTIYDEEIPGELVCSFGGTKAAGAKNNKPTEAAEDQYNANVAILTPSEQKELSALDYLRALQNPKSETQEEGGWNDQEVEVQRAELQSEDKVYEIFKCVLKPQTSTYVYIVHMCQIPLFMYITHAICFVEFVPMCVFQSLISTAITLSVTNVSKKHAFPYICKFM